uniref:WRKY domain-containing protein n=1 Tax=Fagus sylvatica TaxID=28930 RepID=A0A2N9FDD0_FAGSY
MTGIYMLVVRSCKYTATKNNITTTTATSEDPLPCLASLTVKEESVTHFLFSSSCRAQNQWFPKNCNNFANPFSPPPQLVMMVSNPIPPFQTYNNADIQYGLSPPQVLPLCLISTLVSSSTGFRGILLTNNARKFGKKNQQKRTVRHVTAENLLADVWAWRKNMDKSPSKAHHIQARKQVERSNTEPNIFIITYTGEHTHPRPHSSKLALAGSVRNKFSASNNSISDTNNIASCSSPQSATCLSPTTPLTEAVNDHQQNINEEINKKESEELMDDNDEVEVEEEENEDDILIPNIAMNVNDDIFMGASRAWL